MTTTFDFQSELENAEAEAAAAEAAWQDDFDSQPSVNEVFLRAEGLLRRVGFTLVDVCFDARGTDGALVIGRRSIDHDAATEFAVWSLRQLGLSRGHYTESLREAIEEVESRGGMVR